MLRGKVGKRVISEKNERVATIATRDESEHQKKKNESPKSALEAPGRTRQKRSQPISQPMSDSKKNQAPNKASEPTLPAVTIRAAARLAPAGSVAHL